MISNLRKYYLFPTEHSYHKCIICRRKLQGGAGSQCVNFEGHSDISLECDACGGMFYLHTKSKYGDLIYRIDKIYISDFDNNNDDCDDDGCVIYDVKENTLIYNIISRCQSVINFNEYTIFKFTPTLFNFSDLKKEIASNKDRIFAKLLLI